MGGALVVELAPFIQGFLECNGENAKRGDFEEIGRKTEIGVGCSGVGDENREERNA